MAGIWCLPKNDKAGNEVCVLSLLNEQNEKYDPAEELLKQGLAKFDRDKASFLPLAVDKYYRTAEHKAKIEKLGIWSEEEK